MPTVEIIKIPRAVTPEEVGVSSDAVLAMIKDMEKAMPKNTAL